MPDERTLAFLRELERADEAVAATIAELDELAHETEAVRARALAVEEFLVRLPQERAAAEAAAANGRETAESGRRELAEAQAEVAAAERDRDDRRVAEARHRVVRAQDALHMAERRLAEALAEHAGLDEREESSRRETGELEERALTLANALRARPRLAEQAGEDPAPGLEGVAGWASTARAALFVARGGLASEREAVVRQASELGALVLGEPLVAGSAADIVRRVSREAG